MLATHILITFPEGRKRSLGAPLPTGEISWTSSDGIEHHQSVPVHVLKKLNAQVADQHDEDDLLTLLDALSHQQAFERVVKMYERRDHPCSEYRSKLIDEGYSEEVVAETLDKAREYNIVDDVRFAESFITQKSSYSGWGRKRIEFELSKRQVDPYLVDGYPEKFFSFVDDVVRATQLLMKKRIPERDPYHKLYRFLIGKGFDSHVASQAVKQYLHDQTDLL